MASINFQNGTIIPASWLNDVNNRTYNPIPSTDVSYDPPFTGSVITNVEAKLAQTVSVKDFGAVGDGVTDDTTAIQAALDSGKNIVVPEGSYAISGTLLMQVDSQVFEMNGILLRIGASTAPVIRINCNRAKLFGTGTIYTLSNNTPNGIVLIGPVDPTTDPQANILWNTVRGLSLWGNDDSTSKGLVFHTKEAYGGTEPNYFNWIENNIIQHVHDGIYLISNCNGQMFTNNQFYYVSNHCMSFRGDVGTGGISDCITQGTNVHFSANTTIIYADYVDRCVFSAIGGEPGGSSKLYNFTANTNSNIFSGYNNASSASINNGTLNSFNVNGTLLLDSLTIPSVTATTLTATSYAVAGGLRQQSLAKTVTVGSSINFDISSTNAGFVRVRFIASYVGNTQYQLQAQYGYITINNLTGGATATREDVYSNQAGNALFNYTDITVSRPSNGVMRVTYSPTSGTGDHSVSLYVDGVFTGVN